MLSRDPISTQFVLCNSCISTETIVINAEQLYKLSTCQQVDHSAIVYPQCQNSADMSQKLCPTSCLYTTANKHVHPLHNVILLWVIRVLFAGYLQNSRDSLVIVLKNVPDVCCNMLVDENNANIIPLRKIKKSLLHLFQFCVRLNNEEVGWIGSPVSNTGEDKPCHGVLYRSPMNEKIGWADKMLT